MYVTDIENQWKTLKGLINEVGGQGKLYYLPWRKYEPNPVFDRAYALCKEMYDILDGKTVRLSNGNLLVPIPDRYKVDYVKEMEIYESENDKVEWEKLKIATEDEQNQHKVFWRLYLAALADNPNLPKRQLELFPENVQDAEKVWGLCRDKVRIMNIEMFDRLNNRALRLSGKAYLCPIPNMYSGNYVVELRSTE